MKITEQGKEQYKPPTENQDFHNIKSNVGSKNKSRTWKKQTFLPMSSASSFATLELTLSATNLLLKQSTVHESSSPSTVTIFSLWKTTKQKLLEENYKSMQGTHKHPPQIFFSRTTTRHFALLFFNIAGCPNRLGACLQPDPQQPCSWSHQHWKAKLP